MSNLRQLVLKSFKNLHRIRKKVFFGDEKALTAARIKINEEFSKNKRLENEESIRAMIKLGDDVAHELKTQIIQLKQVKPGIYKAKINEDTLKLENIPYNDNAIIEESTSKKMACCQKQTSQSK